MGAGVTYECNKCGYIFSKMTGIGYLFPMVYEECIKDARAGKYGEEIKQFLLQHPDGALNCEKTAYVCEGCGNLVIDYDLTMYLPKKDAKFKDNGYFMPDELAENFDVYKKYQHKCESCGGNMRPLKSREIPKCPKCKEKLVQGKSRIMWD